ncbi:DUF2306 domain-containing protein [Leptobacterium flavescens]|uniref:DUF2306 domain-containing protein n=1 Tax=Leptobacterium flavescens TaxID=472055 RepID=A0A6P0UQN8_9FLAO|nr:DUF2306 domain-containing protein [Leptobacterium flavescens]NER14139.1 DUF2306 domain-containing protein [Leptobacterium flavescens]
MQLTFSTTGFIHLISAVIALISGTIVFVLRKGGSTHKRLGYVYVISMIVMLVTSFMIYRLFNGFGLFHFFSVVSTLTLIGGMLPALRRKPEKKWLGMHFSFMYWSVIGLYAAFVAEVLTRVPSTPFFGMLGIAIAVVMIIASIAWRRKKKEWNNLFKL